MALCREKLFNYFDIEPKYISLTEDCFVATPEKIAAACDKNTIGVVAILGTTYSGHFEDVEGIDDAVSEPPDRENTREIPQKMRMKNPQKIRMKYPKINALSVPFSVFVPPFLPAFFVHIVLLTSGN